jgi:S-DNA-T family DNA segregation ATPase FtsK/SpoIIIE
MASYQVRQRDPLLDQSMQAMVEKRGKELLGLGLVVLAGVLTLMLATYSPADPGWMVSTDEPAANALGRFGAAAASTLIIIGGLAAWGLPLVAAVWGGRLMLHIGEDRLVGRMIFALLAIALGSVYAATHVPGPGWTHAFGLGGLFGDTVLGAILGVAPVSATAGLKVVSFLLMVLLVGAALFVLGFNAVELRAIGRFLYVGLVVSYAATLAALRLGGRGTMRAATAGGGVAAAALRAGTARMARGPPPRRGPRPRPPRRVAPRPPVPRRCSSSRRSRLPPTPAAATCGPIRARLPHPPNRRAAGFWRACPAFCGVSRNRPACPRLRHRPTSWPRRSGSAPASRT